MSALSSYLLGLIVAQVAWLFFTTGRLLRRRQPDNSKPLRLGTLVITFNRVIFDGIVAMKSG